MAIIEIFYRKYFKNNEGKLNSGNFNNKCIVPYDCHLGYLYKYLQQAEMESNGKLNSGQFLIWGGIGTDVQHSFFQMLHQNDENVLLEILLPAKNLYTEPENFNKSNVILNQNEHKLYKRNIDSDLNSIQFTKRVKLDDLVEESFNENLSFIKDHHKLLLANGLAQSRALMNGKDNSDEKLLFKGNKPTTTILYSKLTPDVLGYLLSIYEHKIFTVGSYYQVNSFDQFGVQLGKEIAIEIYENKENFDESTKKLLELIE
ncbi:G6PI [Hepatospora eriocheir]|uniref:glucose-6-phosphate isomerase n=1 Tax=Hepatospora eriocheir TaxID=1081669 RepID=A0A1X0Q6V2_9MICR|nr:G6PI [Hepatospora eriocheir]